MNLHELNTRRFRNVLLAGEYGNVVAHTTMDEDAVRSILQRNYDRTVEELDVDMSPPRFRLNVETLDPGGDPLAMQYTSSWRATVAPTIWETHEPA